MKCLETFRTPFWSFGGHIAGTKNTKYFDTAAVDVDPTAMSVNVQGGPQTSAVHVIARKVGPSRARCKTPRPLLSSTAQGQRLGVTGATGGAPDGPEHAPTTPTGVPRNCFTSVMSIVCYIAPTANTPLVFGTTVFLFFQQSVRPYVAIITTQMVDIQVM